VINDIDHPHGRYTHHQIPTVGHRSTTQANLLPHTVRRGDAQSPARGGRHGRSTQLPRSSAWFLETMGSTHKMEQGDGRGRQLTSNWSNMGSAHGTRRTATMTNLGEQSPAHQAHPEHINTTTRARARSSSHTVAPARVPRWHELDHTGSHSVLAFILTASAGRRFRNPERWERWRTTTDIYTRVWPGGYGWNSAKLLGFRRGDLLRSNGELGWICCGEEGKPDDVGSTW
jgi:hypothetical protein